jgi:hypothetical protein
MRPALCQFSFACLLVEVGRVSVELGRLQQLLHGGVGEIEGDRYISRGHAAPRQLDGAHSQFSARLRPVQPRAVDVLGIIDH